MATRKQRAEEPAAGIIPPELYRGLELAVRTGYPQGGPSSREMHEWSQRVREAGFITSGALVATADTDEGFQRWLVQHERKRRLCAMDVAAGARRVT